VDEEQLKALITALGESLRADLAASIEKLGAKCDALAEEIAAKKKADTFGERSGENEDDLARGDIPNVAARRTAADHRADSVDPAAFASLARTVHDMRQQ
jgi:hypothetical protein